MKMFIFGLSLLLLTNLSFSVELWNGFTTDMSKAEAVNKAISLLNMKSPGESQAVLEISGYEIPDIRRKSEYKYINFMYLESNNVYKIFRLYFKNDNLIGIMIVWVATPEEVLNAAIKQMGGFLEKKEVYSKYNRLYLTYKWEFPERYVFLERNTSSELPWVGTYFLSRKFIVDLTSEQENEKRVRAEDDAKRRKEAASGVNF
jgi:hypothetical protein